MYVKNVGTLTLSVSVGMMNKLFEKAYNYYVDAAGELLVCYASLKDYDLKSANLYFNMAVYYSELCLRIEEWWDE